MIITREYNGIIIVRYDRGYMEIYRDIFPVSKDWLRKWLKVVRLDYQHETEILTDLAEYLEDRIDWRKLEKTNYAEESDEFKALSRKHKKYISNLEIIRKRLEVIR